MPIVLDISALAINTSQTGTFKGTGSNNLAVGFYNRKQGPSLFSLHSNVGMMASDLPDLLKVGRRQGPTGPLWDMPSANVDTITMRVTAVSYTHLRAHET